MQWPSLKLFKQQRLPAWQPLLTPRYVATYLMMLAAVLIPVGIVLMVANAKATDFTVRYDHINRCTSASNTGAFEYSGDGEVLRRGCVTKVNFTLSKRLAAPVYLYYGLTEFYQNHRRFSNSKSDAQLAGSLETPHSLSHTSPLAYPGELHDRGNLSIVVDGKSYRYRDCVYAPAGLIPWSMFNDTFRLFKVNGKIYDSSATLQLVCNSSAFSQRTNEPLENGAHTEGRGCRKKGIAWETDVEHKYKAPELVTSPNPVWSASWMQAYNVTTSPSNDTYFRQGWYAGELGHQIPVTTDEDLMVWARPASLPIFRKLFRVITEDLEPGDYTMHIDEHYDVSSFGGEKSFTLATLSWLGGRNTFLANMYVWTGIIAAVAAVAFAHAHNYYGDRAQEVLTWLLHD